MKSTELGMERAMSAMSGMKEARRVCPQCFHVWIDKHGKDECPKCTIQLSLFGKPPGFRRALHPANKNKAKSTHKAKSQQSPGNLLRQYPPDKSKISFGLSNAACHVPDLEHSANEESRAKKSPERTDKLLYYSDADVMAIVRVACAATASAARAFNSEDDAQAAGLAAAAALIMARSPEEGTYANGADGKATEASLEEARQSDKGLAKASGAKRYAVQPTTDSEGFSAPTTVSMMADAHGGSAAVTTHSTVATGTSTGADEAQIEQQCKTQDAFDPGEPTPRTTDDIRRAMGLAPQRQPPPNGDSKVMRFSCCTTSGAMDGYSSLKASSESVGTRMSCPRCDHRWLDKYGKDECKCCTYDTYHGLFSPLIKAVKLLLHIPTVWQVPSAFFRC